MAETGQYQPEDGEIPAHSFELRRGDSYFSLGTNSGVGTPHYYVCLDENGGERSWWFDPVNAEELGRRLVELGATCRRSNEERVRRTAGVAGELTADDSGNVEGPPAETGVDPSDA